MNERTCSLGEELGRLDHRANELADKLAGMDMGAQGAQLFVRELRDIDQAGKGVAALIDEYGEDATVTVKGLTAAEHGAVEDKVADFSTDQNSRGGLPGTTRVAFAAMGLTEAPFLPDDVPGGPAGLDVKLRAVGDQHPGVVEWLNDVRNNIEGRGSGNWPGLDGRLLERLTD